MMNLSKNKLNLVLIALISIFILNSCATSNEVASNRKIQKRKYNKGYHISGKGHHFFNKKQSTNETLIAAELPQISSKKKPNKIIEDLNHPQATNKIAASADNSITNESDSFEKKIIETQNEDISKTDFFKNSNVSTKQLKSLKRKFIVKANRKKLLSEPEEGATEVWMYYLLAILVPFVAVGLVTDWDVNQVVICILLTLLCYVPGLVYALIKVGENVES